MNDTSKGNGALTYPVGLITADEIVAAGSGKYATRNSSYYLYRPGYWYWSLSPFYMNTSGNARVFISHKGYLDHNVVDSVMDGGGGVAPVINLSANYVKTLRGKGTMTDPYQA